MASLSSKKFSLYLSFFIRQNRDTSGQDVMSADFHSKGIETNLDGKI